jgi:prepilin-type N-terminal cleavage/methylation domain-containing protein
MMTHTPKGFTLIETMVAISILTIAIIGPMFALQQGVVSSYTARDRLVASNLAQDGVEFVHAVRDGNYLYNIANPGSPRSWFYSLDGTNGSVDCTGGTKCAVDGYYNTVLLCSSTCPKLKLLSTGFYNQGAISASNPETGFTRTVQLSRISPTEMKVSVTVNWSTGGLPYSIEIVEYLRDWL